MFQVRFRASRFGFCRREVRSVFEKSAHGLTNRRSRRLHRILRHRLGSRRAKSRRIRPCQN